MEPIISPDKQQVKVLHIIKSLGRGGAEVLLTETLRLHNHNDFSFQYIYFLPWKNQMVDALESNGGIVMCFGARNNFQLIFQVSKVARYVRENDIAIIHAHLPWAGILARLVGKITGVPVIYTEHNKQERYHLGTRLMNLATMGLTTMVVAVSEDVAGSIRANKPRLRIPVVTVSNGVDTDKFDRQKFNGKAIRDQLGIPVDAPVIGTIAVFRHQKRLDLWMTLAARILQKEPRTHFIIVGDGPLKDTLLKKRSHLGLSERIHMPGLETEVRPYLASFDIYMMSSIFEGLPIAMLEAMSMECPVVATAAGGIGEVVRHEMNGLLCDVDASDKLVEHASTLLADKSLRMRYGKNARATVIADFSMKQMVAHLEHLYKQQCKGGQRIN